MNEDKRKLQELENELKNTRDNNIFLIKELAKKKKNDLDQIQKLEKLSTSRGKSIANGANYKKEIKLCEICSQIKQDNFKYSRVSARGFNTYHVYRICSFCQKVVQFVS